MVITGATNLCLPTLHFLVQLYNNQVLAKLKIGDIVENCSTVVGIVVDGSDLHCLSIH